MRYIEIEDNIIDTEDIIMVHKNIYTYKEPCNVSGVETITLTIYRLSILFRYQTKYVREITFKCKDNMDKAYDYIKRTLIK